MVSVNVGLVHYVLDHIYGTLLHRTKLGTPFFSKGWGGTKLDLLERMVKQLFPEAPCQNWPPTAVQPKWKTVWETKNSCLREGVFRTTCDERLIDALPPESHNARVAFLTPKDVSPEKMACVVHLAGTGDHSFERRLRLGGPLLKDNIATMVLESPYYGQRRPSMQHGAKLQCVSDLLLLGKATIDEARSLLYWLQAEAGYGKMGICGLSMGGVHAAMVGSLHPTPIATLPFLAPHSAVVPFCEGLYRHATAWEALREDAAALAKDATSLTEDAASGISIEQVKDRLRSVLSLTDVTRFPLPKNPQAVIFVGATDDGYIPRHSVMELQKAWPGSEVRWVTGGHVSSFLLHNDSFRKAIVDALDRL
ncbi:protein ABHD18 [Triticum urartu]|nr:protein ABHD18 [Aegilops tauschii subsp. strangulata]XP_040248185.1 protein ABHD18 [Aegilops tauschii subsp. strangulata]XP_044419231.1 protein ABHD18-like [Triticum aestivum]XP_044419232.1 protein ABHD18-like [Triticum aestivum]XP_048538900.1 protein ABHD18 [Triticum urartu]